MDLLIMLAIIVGGLLYCYLLLVLFGALLKGLIRLRYWIKPPKHVPVDFIDLQAGTDYRVHTVEKGAPFWGPSAKHLLHQIILASVIGTLYWLFLAEPIRLGLRGLICYYLTGTC